MQGWPNVGAKPAQSFEHLPSKQGVAGSSPAGIANKIKNIARIAELGDSTVGHSWAIPVRPDRLTASMSRRFRVEAARSIVFDA